nr:immunoglobulin heavy chain junction region [Mus musculus]
ISVQDTIVSMLWT